MQWRAICEPWSVGRRSSALLGPILLFGLVCAAVGDGGLVRRFVLLPLAVAFGGLLLLVPSVFILVFVRSGGPFLVCLVAFTVSVPLAVIGAERSTSSTAGLAFLAMPYLASIAALVGAVADAILRRYCRSLSAHGGGNVGRA